MMIVRFQPLSMKPAFALPRGRVGVVGVLESCLANKDDLQCGRNTDGNFLQGRTFG